MLVLGHTSESTIIRAYPVSPSNPTAAPATLVTPVVMTHPTTSPQVNLPVTHPLDTPIGTHVGFHHPLPLPSNQSTMLPSYTAADPTHVIPTLISPTIPQAPIIPQVRLPKLSIKKFNGDINTLFFILSNYFLQVWNYLWIIFSICLRKHVKMTEFLQ